ncbi:hypothetical protein ACFOG5_05265 [Pedobacter fastidiosus]|uniref:Uncharacterized protein n=1 Tax=Pedobacter fastidiosus TaxID=2765361 RepID=A0ABR7KQT3_9SPHI|nr:hypothetical protein [Pedobacter fastidiosus]MBC6110442.1 hypothetical protein [Pedobacter fastidiosus]
MESYVINIPDKKANLVKELLKELGVEISAIGSDSQHCNENHIPNKQTLKAIKEVKAGKGIRFINAKDLFGSIK